MTQRRQSLGRNGEEQAARFLEARGYRILARNVRADRVEIDLIARRGPLLVFVEVKSRRATGPVGPGDHTLAAEAVDARKQARLRRGAAAWLAQNGGERRRSKRMRFDVVTCIHSETRLGRPIDSGRPLARNDEYGPQNDATAPQSGTRWSIEHWTAAF